MHDPSLYSGQSDDGTFVPFTDILFNVLLGFAVMLFIAFALIRPNAQAGNVDVKAEFIISVNWPNDNPDDIDTYVEDPLGDIVWYNQMQKGFMSLDRDDRGFNDTILVNGKKVNDPLRQENVTIRHNVAGEYIVNIYKFADVSHLPTPVSVKIEKVNPKLSVVYFDTITLVQKGDERTAVRFVIDADGNVLSTNSRQISLIQELRK